MKIKLLDEPQLVFGNGEYVCPRFGIENLDAYDFNKIRPEKIKTGIIGNSSSIDEIISWLDLTKKQVEAKESKQPLLFPAFPGFNKDAGFKAEIVYDDSYIRKINNSDFSNLLKNEVDHRVIITNIVNYYITEIKFLTKNKNPDVILCVIPEDVVSVIASVKISPPSESKENQKKAKDSDNLEHDLRRLLKSEAMQYGVPIQIIRDRINTPTKEMQDAATVAWNLYTALYYKASGTPWAMKRRHESIVCYAGISFYRSRDRKTLQTSCTQIFNEHGRGVILRGAPVEMKKGDREPHLSENQAYELLDKSLGEYYEALKIFPQRLVLHKSSNFNESEIQGFRAAAYKNNISAVDLITIMPTDMKLFGTDGYPPKRGTLATIDKSTYLLYTKGFVNYYNTYPGQYIPNPIEIRLFSHDESPEIICDEILTLTKMNWNNTQFDRRIPITLDCSRKVGEILKYLPDHMKPQIRYSFYM